MGSKRLRQQKGDAARTDIDRNRTVSKKVTQHGQTLGKEEEKQSRQHKRQQQQDRYEKQSRQQKRQQQQQDKYEKHAKL